MEWKEDLLCEVYKKLLKADSLIELQVKEIDLNRDIEIAILLDDVVSKLDVIVSKIESE